MGLIAYSSDKNGQWEIFVRSIDGADEENLTNNLGNDFHPTWSPQGDKLLFYSDRDGNYEIYVMNADGSGQKILSNNPAWDTAPDWSSDGKQVVFSSDRDGNFQIYTMNIDGSNIKRFTNDEHDNSSPAWDPHGSYIAYTSTRDDKADVLFLLWREGMKLTLYIFFLDRMNVIMLLTSLSEIYAFVSSGKDGGINVEKFPESYSIFKGQNINAPTWSPDGQWIAFQCMEDNVTGICLININDKKLVEFSGFSDNYLFPDSSPIPKKIEEVASLEPTAELSPTEDLQGPLKKEWGGVITNAWICKAHERPSS